VRQPASLAKTGIEIERNEAGYVAVGKRGLAAGWRSSTKELHRDAVEAAHRKLRDLEKRAVTGPTQKLRNP
jgi:hypothetical protein